MITAILVVTYVLANGMRAEHYFEYQGLTPYAQCLERGYTTMLYHRTQLEHIGHSVRYINWGCEVVQNDRKA